jgi:hypothetical protein
MSRLGFINPFDQLSPFSATFRDTLNATARAAQRFSALESSIKRKLMEVEQPRRVVRSRFMAILGGPAGPPFAPNRYNYAWSEAALGVTNEWAPLPGGRSSTDPGRRNARNLAEANNTATTVLMGILLNDPPIMVTMHAIPAGVPIELMEFGLADDAPGNGDVAYWFYLTPRISVECVQTPPSEQNRSGPAVTADAVAQ